MSLPPLIFNSNFSISELKSKYLFDPCGKQQQRKDGSVSYFSLCATTRPKVGVLINLFRLFAQNHLTKVYGPLSFILSFVHDHLTKTCGPLSFIFSFVHDYLAKT